MSIPRRPTVATSVIPTLEALLTMVRGLPLGSPLPGAIAVLLDRPQTTIADIVQALQRDPALAMRVLRAVNSAYYGMKDPIRTVARAVQLIGFETIREYLDQPSPLCIFTLRLHANAAINTRLDGLWRHALATGAAARVLARDANFQRQFRIDDATPFVAACILHDVGKSIFSLLIPTEYERCIWAAASEGIPLIQAERRLFPFDHAMLGRQVCQEWGLTEVISNAVGRHHTLRGGGLGGGADIDELTAMVHVADILARTYGVGWWGDRSRPQIDGRAIDILRLRSVDITDLLNQIDEEYPRMEAQFDIVFPPRPLGPANAA